MGDSLRRGLDGALRALAHPVRRELLWLTWGTWRSAGELADYFTLSQPTISQHLKVLRDAGLLRSKPEGTRRLFRMHAPALEEVYSLLGSAVGAPHLKVWDAGGGEEPTDFGPCRLRLETRLPCGPDTVFPFFTEEKEMRRWLGPSVRSDNRVGGVFAFEIDGRWRCRGRFHVLDPPRQLLFVWSFREGSAPLPSGTNTVRVTISGTRKAKVAIEHYGHDEELLPTHRDSWRRMLTELEKAVEKSRTARPAPQRRRR